MLHVIHHRSNNSFLDIIYSHLLLPIVKNVYVSTDKKAFFRMFFFLPLFCCLCIILTFSKFLAWCGTVSIESILLQIKLSGNFLSFVVLEELVMVLFSCVLFSFCDLSTTVTIMSLVSSLIQCLFQRIQFSV